MALTQVIKDLLESGVHFGHLSKHWNPKMKKFIFGKKKNIYIIDLEKTAEKLNEAREFTKKLAAEGKKILFVATKKQLRDLIKEEACACDMPYVSERWAGGLLTNFHTIRERVKRYIMLLEKKEKGELDLIPRKEATRIKRELERMDRIYRGIISLAELPGCVYVVDPKREVACVREANKLSIPIIALIDTDADPDVIDYPIPGNDDAIKSVRYVSSSLVEVIKEEIKKSAEIIKAKAEKDAEEEKLEEKSLNIAKYDELDVELKEKETKAVPRKRAPRKEG
jgi:small subunit ribosomal protein S2